MKNLLQSIRSNKVVLTLFIILILYTYTSVYQLNLPGLHYDEANEAGLPALQIANQHTINTFRNVGIGNQNFPIMVQDYIGALHIYFSIPFITILGPTSIGIRIPSILLGLTILIVNFGYIRTISNEKISLLATLLLANHPSFVFWNRQGTLIASFTLIVLLCLLWACHNWHTKSGWKSALLIGFLSGLGVYSKIIFLWILGGIFGLIVIMNIKALLRKSKNIWPKKPTKTDIVCVTSGFFIGITPLLLFLYKGQGSTLTRTTEMFKTNTNIITILLGRLDQFIAVLTSSNYLWYLGGSPGNRFWLAALAIGLFIIYLDIRKNQLHNMYPHYISYIFIISFLLIPLTPTPSGMFPHHFALLTPLWTTIVAFSIVRIPSLIKQSISLKKSYYFATIILVIWSTSFLVSRDLISNLLIHRNLMVTGGESPHSDAIYNLANHLDKLESKHVVSLDWGFAPQIQYLTNNRIKPIEIYGFTTNPENDFHNRIDSFYPHTNTIYIMHTKDKTFIDRHEHFNEYVAKIGYQTKKKNSILQTNGTPIFELFTIEKR